MSNDSKIKSNDRGNQKNRTKNTHRRICGWKKWHVRRSLGSSINNVVKFLCISGPPSPFVVTFRKYGLCNKMVIWLTYFPLNFPRGLWMPPFQTSPNFAILHLISACIQRFRYGKPGGKLLWFTFLVFLRRGHYLYLKYIRVKDSKV